MLKLIDVALDEASVLMPEKELRQIVADADHYEKLFFDLLRACLLALGRTQNPEIQIWIREHYVELRPLPEELKQLYLSNVAFRKA